MARLFLRDAAPGDLLDDVYVLTNKQFSTGNNGKHYIKGFVSDRSQQVTARIWNATRELFNAIPDNGFVRVRGRAENYQGNLQVVIDQVWPAKEGTYELADLLPHTEKHIPTMCGKIVELLQSVQNRFVAALLQAYLDDQQLMDNFCRAPAATNFHHAFLGGLLEHTLNALEVADAIIRFYPGLSRDLVLAGIFLHDIAKTWELSYDTSFTYTDAGQLVGHVVKSAMWLEEKARQAEKLLGEPVPRRIIDVLQHIILSHHGTLEFGAAREPMTPEAVAVHLIEHMDAKLMMALSATRQPRGGEDGNWTEYVKSLGVRLYRPDVSLDEPSEPTASQPPSGAEPTDAAEAETPPEPRDLAAPADAKAQKPLEAGQVSLLINNPMFETVPTRRK